MSTINWQPYMPLPTKEAETRFTEEYINYLIKENERLNNIIDKAISLLKEAGCYDEEAKTFCDDVWEELPDLLNILQGGEE